jgi:hypothetical protein
MLVVTISWPHTPRDIFARSVYTLETKLVDSARKIKYLCHMYDVIGNGDGKIAFIPHLGPNINLRDLLSQDWELRPGEKD